MLISQDRKTNPSPLHTGVAIINPWHEELDR